MFKHISYVSLTLYFRTNGVVHLQATLVLYARISLWEKS